MSEVLVVIGFAAAGVVAAVAIIAAVLWYQEGDEDANRPRS